MKHIFELRMKDQIEERSSQLFFYLIFHPQFKYMFHIFTFIYSSFTGILRTHNMSWLDSSVGRALHRHRRGHGFESRSSLNFFFFRLSFRNCLSCVVTARIFLPFDVYFCDKMSRIRDIEKAGDIANCLARKLSSGLRDLA